MSHEIRTPISGIIGLSEHLLDCNLSKEQTEFVHSILESAKFLLTIVNDILDLGKIESGHMDVEAIPFSPYKLVRDVIIPLRIYAKEKGLELSSKSEVRRDTVLLGDAWRMRQILTNLVSNGLKFTAIGHVELLVRALEQKEPGTMMLQFTVHDSGVGMGPDVMKALFKPFHQADSSTARLHGGTGLGLAICQQLLELMNGHIVLKSSPGKGTTVICNVPFSIYDGPVTGATSLPRRARFFDGGKKPKMPRPRSTQPDVGLTNESPLSSDSSRSTSSEKIINVLVVEDNPVNRKVIALSIEKLGYAVYTASDGQEACDFLCKTPKHLRPATIFMDCQMPVCDGYEATRRIRSNHDMFDEETRNLPIIALTASAIKGDREKCWDAGMDDYLTKPAARDALERALAKWTAVRRPHELGHKKSMDSA